MCVVAVLNSSLYYHRLVVTSVNANNTGTYSCQATNAHGNRDTSTATLEILTECESLPLSVCMD